MYARILKFLTNLLFKPFSRGFLTPRKKREPNQWTGCIFCDKGFMAFNKRQKICKGMSCRKILRSRQYREGLKRKRLEANKTTIDSMLRRDFADLESEE